MNFLIITIKPMQTNLSDRHVYYVRVLCVVLLLIASAYLVVHTIHWPLCLDAQVIHYADFLMDHGFAPYRDIGDMNMPGAYLADNFAIHVFGAFDLGWRIYDFFLLLVMTLSMIVIARPYDWLAGLFAGVLFALIHASDGPMNTGQRDEVMAVLLVAAYACLFHSIRHARPRWMALFGFACGMAATIKPTAAPLFFLVLPLVAWTLRAGLIRTAPFLLYALAGGVLAAAVFFGFLLHYHALGDFIAMDRTLTPYYAKLERLGFLPLLRECIPRPMRILVPFGLVVAFLNYAIDRRNWERWALLLGVSVGAFSYFVQRKGFPHHRYPLVAFTLLWFAIEFAISARRSGWVRVLGTAGLALGIFGLVPEFTLRLRAAGIDNSFTWNLESDLTSIGVARLQRSVQCLDMVDGCLNALYHLGIVQSTGLTGDTLLFWPDDSPVVERARQAFWNSIQAAPPAVFVLTNERFIRKPDFNKLDDWPRFNRFLDSDYDLVAQREFDRGHAYRIYVLKKCAH